MKGTLTRAERERLQAKRVDRTDGIRAAIVYLARKGHDRLTKMLVILAAIIVGTLALYCLVIPR